MPGNEKHDNKTKMLNKQKINAIITVIFRRSILVSGVYNLCLKETNISFKSCRCAHIVCVREYNE